jgi:phosphopentomutase
VENKDPQLMHIGFGNTDEFGHRNNKDEYLKALSWVDEFLYRLEYSLSSLGVLEDTTIIVTTDHGRSNNFRSHGRDKDSSRVWLISNRKLQLEGDRLSSIAPEIRRILSI